MPHADRVLFGPAVWSEIRKAASRPGRRYITSAYAGRHAAELVPLGEGDVAVIDASDRQLRAGATSPEPVSAWLKAGAYVYSLPDLHAKAYVLGNCAFVGSANASLHSEQVLTEAVLHTDRTELRSQLKNMILALSELALQPLDQRWVTHAKELYRPPRRPRSGTTPGQEQILPAGRFRVHYSSWASTGLPLSSSESKTVAELKGPGVDVWVWSLLADHGLEVRDVVVLMEFDEHDRNVALWPPMQVLQKGAVRRSGNQGLFLRHSKRLAPLPANEGGVNAALQGVRDGGWVTGERRRRMLELWDLAEPRTTPKCGRASGAR